MPPASAIATPPQSNTTRHFGRFELRQMLGRTLASSTWLAVDARLRQDVLLCVPRAQPATPAERQTWLQQAQSASRLQHPRLAEVLEVGEHDAWPFVTCSRGTSQTLGERLSRGPAPSPLEVANWVAEILEGLAYAHDAGLAHLDIGLHTVLVDANDHAVLLGVGVGVMAQAQTGQALPGGLDRHQLRQANERDVLMVGLLLHRLLCGHAALDDSDLGSAAGRVGPEIVRLPWTTPSPVPETLRAIVNRATDRQQRQRYLSARTLLSALQGWIKTNALDAAGPLLLLLDRLNSVGSLPSRVGMERPLQKALNEETLRVDDFVDVVARNPTLGWAMLRAVNNVSFQSRSADDGVTTLSRAIVLLGQQGLRKVAGGLRSWPGVLQAQASLNQSNEDPSVDALNKALKLACVAGHIARLLVPFSANDEEALMAATSQKLGWLLVLYHFPDEANQITRLMQPGVPLEPDAPPTPGMSQDAAASAVLGINLDDLTTEVLRHWGLHERLVQASRPLNVASPIRKPKSVEETLRTVASLSNELTTALTLEGAKAASAFQQAVVRYARALDLSTKECQQTVETAIRLVEGRSKPAPMLS